MSDLENASILVVCAHPDDECLGAGGTIHRHVDQGISVDIHCMTGNKVRNQELSNACEKLGVRNVYLSDRDDFEIDWSLTKEVIGAILKSRPTIILTHSANDYNRNHMNCALIVNDAVEWASHVTIFDDAHRVEKVYHMEINSLLPKPNVMVDVSQSYEIAILALQEHKSQLTKGNDYYLQLYDARTRLRGVQAACVRAEAFTITLPEHAGPFYPRNSVERLI